ncbi:glycosyl transferases group 1 [Clostridium oryzae]|uniref:Glycosyl transferases group 1 n=1 Tax=Clostridium oryzae TaxID=1450648 RepID=A0A1V4IRQ5_9CLOT|nr:glycosyl transferases group 1 [Clostridium oryzae]
MNARNIALIDSNLQETEEFICGLKESTGLEWKPIICTSNQGRKNKFDNLKRYFKYFWFPLKIFIQRKKYDNIIGWQEFYGLIYAFYCRLFHVKKSNFLVIENFIYKPKKGIIGKIYFRFMRYIATGKYVDIFTSASDTNCKFCSDVFNLRRDKFVFLPFGVNDMTKAIDTSLKPTCDFVLSIGRSNRDWDVLIKSFKETKYPLRIVCDELRVDSPSGNIKIYNNIWNEESYKFFYNCKCVVITIDKGEIASGDTVLLLAMSFSKPIIITRPSCLANDYVIDEYNGLVVDKDPQTIIKAVERIYSDKELYEKLSQNARVLYEKKYTLYKYGINVGNTIKKSRCF